MKELTGNIEFESNIQASLLDGDKIVVEFFTPSCVSCRLTQQLLERQEPEWTVYSVDASKEENREVIEKWKITSVPTVLTYYMCPNRAAHSSDFGPSYRGKQLIEAIKQEFSGMCFEWYQEIDGNLFDLNSSLALFPDTTSTDYVLAHCIAADFGMYGGIAKQFVNRFNMREMLKEWDISHKIFSKFEIVGKSIFIPQHGYYVQGTYNLITKPYTGEQPKEASGYQMIQETLTDTREQMKERKQQYLAMPQIGCGIDGLSWDVVSRIIQEVFRDSGIKVLIVILKK